MNWWNENRKQNEAEYKKTGVCTHRDKAVMTDKVECMSCGKILADNHEDAIKYFA